MKYLRKIFDEFELIAILRELGSVNLILTKKYHEAKSSAQLNEERRISFLSSFFYLKMTRQFIFILKHEDMFNFFESTYLFSVPIKILAVSENEKDSYFIPNQNIYYSDSGG
ncbi:MAG: hypothetical protein ACMUEM_05560 [Flavobacteriales bacterium AspAUS03]